MTRARVALCCAVLALVSLYASAARAQLPALRARQIVGGLAQPLDWVQDPLDANVQFVVQKEGLIRVVVNGQLVGTPFLDMTAEVFPTTSERGLLGLAFAPDHATSRRLYISYTNTVGDSVVARLLRSTVNPLTADKSTLVPFRWGSSNGPTSIDQPFDNQRPATALRLC